MKVTQYQLISRVNSSGYTFLIRLAYVSSLLLWFYLMTSVGAAFSEDYSGIANEYQLPKWITGKKIAAGYLYDYNDINKLSKIKKSGLNTLIVKSWQYDSVNTKKTLAKIKKWGRACQEAGIHTFQAYNWQPQEVELEKYRRAIFSNGEKARFVCPLDKEFWENHLTRIGKYISIMSNRSEVAINGLLLDIEMYRTEDLANIKRFYSEETCYCKYCFESFLNKNHIIVNDKLTIKPEKRYDFIKEKGLEKAYNEYLSNEVATLAVEFRKAIHTIKANLLLAVYPYPYENNWVINEVVKSFGTQELPVLLFSVDTYYKGGHDRIPKSYGSAYKSKGINALNIPGYLFRKYSSASIFENIIHSVEKADGYWLYRLPQLWEESTNSYDVIAGDSMDDYWKAIEKANKLSRVVSIEVVE